MMMMRDAYGSFNSKVLNHTSSLSLRKRSVWGLGLQTFFHRTSVREFSNMWSCWNHEFLSLIPQIIHILQEIQLAWGKFIVPRTRSKIHCLVLLLLVDEGLLWPLLDEVFLHCWSIYHEHLTPTLTLNGPWVSPGTHESRSFQALKGTDVIESCLIFKLVLLWNLYIFYDFRFSPSL